MRIDLDIFALQSEVTLESTYVRCEKASTRSEGLNRVFPLREVPEVCIRLGISVVSFGIETDHRVLPVEEGTSGYHWASPTAASCSLSSIDLIEDAMHPCPKK
jgi:hypothetical protein